MAPNLFNFNSETVPPIDPKSFRSAYLHIDLSSAEKMCRKINRDLFGDFDVEIKLSQCFHSVCLENQSGKPIAYMCLDNHPWTLSVPPWDWEYWLHKLYNLKIINSWNTFWINFLAWSEEYTDSFLFSFLRCVFLKNSFTKYLLMIIPPYFRNISWLENHGTRIFPKGLETNNCQTLMLFISSNILPRYKIRRAVEEDNDDIVSMIKTKSSKLSEMYGDYYIAEILTRHSDTGRQIIVAEYEGVAVAALCLNEHVNLDLLIKHFELVPLFNLRRYPEEEIEYLYDFSEPYPTYGEEEEIDDFEENLAKNEVEVEQEEILVEEDKEKIANKKKVSISSDLESRTVSELEVINENDEDEVDLVSYFNLPTFSKTKRESLDDKGMMKISIESEYISNLFDRESKVEQSTTQEAKLRRQRSKTKLDSYIGESAAFAIEFAAGLEEHINASIPKLLSAAFECFPDRYFAVICLHPECMTAPILTFFHHTAPKPDETFEHHAYFVHRDYIFGTPSARKAKPYDYDLLERALKGSKIKQSFLDMFTKSVTHEDNDLMSYVLLLNNKIIAVAILRPLYNFKEIHDLYQLKSSYNSKVQKPDTYGKIEFGIRSPVFAKMEILRFSDFSILFYELNFSDTIIKDQKRIFNSFIEMMIPAKVKKRPELVNTVLSPEDMEFLDRKELPFVKQPHVMQMVTNKPILSRPKFHIDYKIVVVGTGKTSLAFLEALLIDWSPEYCLTYSNLTVVSPHGLSKFDYDDKDFIRVIRRDMFPAKTSFRERQAHLIAIRALVNQIFGVVTAIDRKNKLVIIDGETSIQYDLLFLFCGEQFQKPNFNPRNILQVENGKFPENIFIVNTETDAECSLQKLLEILSENEDPDFKVLVYGSFLETYCCLTALLALGIQGRNLILIDPPHFSQGLTLPSFDPRPIPDDEVFEAIQKCVSETGVTIFADYEYMDWDYDTETNLITGIRLKSKTERVFLPCIAMYIYYYRTVSSKTFMAISKAGLIFDGGLVISSEGRTNDPLIYAAGTMTKYSRKYYADHLSQRYFDLEEVGSNLGKKVNEAFKNILIRGRKGDSLTRPFCLEGDSIVRTYVKPLKTYCKLPGNLYYIHITKPGKHMSKDIIEAAGEYGQDLITGDINNLENQGFFKIYLNKHGFIESITCLSKVKVHTNNLFSIWGKHECFFNNLLLRYEMGLIDDFFEYFKQPWTFALFQDDFSDLVENIMNILFRLPDSVTGQSVGENVTELHRWYKWKDVPKVVQDELEEEFLNSEYPEAIKNLVINYITEREHILPMYFVPNKDIHLFYAGNENSTLFKPQ